MLNLLSKLNDYGLMLIVGLLLVLAGWYQITDITKLQISPSPHPNYLTGWLGVALIAASVARLFLGERSFSLSRSVAISRTKCGYLSHIGDTEIEVILGRIDQCEPDDRAVIVLPTTEFFEPCIGDPKTALGAYMRSHFPAEIPGVQAMIDAELKKFPSEAVRKSAEVEQPSYGIGTCVYLAQPSPGSPPLIVTSVTTERDGEGVRAEVPSVFRVVEGIARTMAKQRLTSVYVPLLGAGHGGLRPAAALMTLLLAFCAVRSKTFGQRIKRVHIVVFRADERSAPAVNERQIKSTLAAVLNTCMEGSGDG